MQPIKDSKVLFRHFDHKRIVETTHVIKSTQVYIFITNNQIARKRFGN